MHISDRRTKKDMAVNSHQWMQLYCHTSVCSLFVHQRRALCAATCAHAQDHTFYHTAQAGFSAKKLRYWGAERGGGGVGNIHLHGHDSQPREQEAGTAVDTHTPQHNQTRSKEHHDECSQAQLHFTTLQSAAHMPEYTGAGFRSPHHVKLLAQALCKPL